MHIDTHTYTNTHTYTHKHTHTGHAPRLDMKYRTQERVNFKFLSHQNVDNYFQQSIKFEKTVVL
jgi:hypothetical protein